MYVCVLFKFFGHDTISFIFPSIWLSKISISLCDTMHLMYKVLPSCWHLLSSLIQISRCYKSFLIFWQILLNKFASWEICTLDSTMFNKFVNSTSKYLTTNLVFILGSFLVCFPVKVLWSLSLTSIRILCRIFTFLFFSMSFVKDVIRSILSSSSLIRFARVTRVDDLVVLSSPSFCFHPASSLTFLSSSSFSFSSLSFYFFSSPCFFSFSILFFSSSIFLFSSSILLFSSSFLPIFFFPPFLFFFL